MACPGSPLIVRRDSKLEGIENWIQASVQYAWDHPEASSNYVMTHAQEMSVEVAQSHIDLYMVGASPHLDGDYAGFGQVIEGIEVVHEIENAET